MKKMAVILPFGVFLLIWAFPALMAWSEGGPGKGGKQDCDHCKEPSAVLAIVNGQKIYASEVEEPLKDFAYSLEMNLYLAKKGMLEQRINSLLVEEEARQRKVSVEELMRTEVAAIPVTDADARKFYEQNRARMKGELKDYKEQIVAFLRMQTFTNQLRKKADVELFLTAPEEPAFLVSADDDPYKGNEDAPVTIIEFSDFQ